MNKLHIFETLLNRVQVMIQRAEDARQQSQEEANHHKGAMESRYDTFKEEAQALATAQTIRKGELVESESLIQQILENKSILEKEHTKVQISSIVTLIDDDDNPTIYIISPSMGGEKVDVEGQTIAVLTPTSPLGMKVIGKKIDADVSLSIGDVKKLFYIDSIA